MCRGTPRIANSSSSVSITSSLVMPRSSFKAKHSRVYSSTNDSQFSWLPLAFRSNTKSQHHTSLGFSARRRWHPLALEPNRRLFASLQALSAPPVAAVEILETTQRAILLPEEAGQVDDSHTGAWNAPTAASASRAAARLGGA